MIKEINKKIGRILLTAKGLKRQFDQSDVLGTLLLLLSSEQELWMHIKMGDGVHMQICFQVRSV